MRVFFACHWEDRNHVDLIRRGFEAGGIRTWVEWHDSPTGVPWLAAVERALDECGLLLYFLSGDSLLAERPLTACRLAIGRRLPVGLVRLGYLTPGHELQQLVGSGPWLEARNKDGPALLRELRLALPALFPTAPVGPPPAEDPLHTQGSLSDRPGMFCQSCGRENPEFRPMCKSCGSSLILDVQSSATSISCEACTAMNLADARYCRACGTVFAAPIPEPLPEDGARLTPVHATFIGRRLGQWRLTRLLGWGGQGTVHEAIHVYLRTPAALKVMHRTPALPLHGSACGETIRRCLRGLARLDSPLVARVQDFGEETVDGTPCHYLVTELVRGRSASDYLMELAAEDGSGLPLVRRLFVQLCRAVAAAHEIRYTDDCGFELVGVCHGDIKPSNLLVLPDGSAKLIDFLVLGGRLDAGPPNEQGTVAYGSPGYMAPEQFNDGIVSVATDIYSLGATLLEMLSRCRARDIPADPGAAWLDGMLARRNPSARAYAPLLSRCLATNPKSRFCSALELLSQLPAT